MRSLFILPLFILTFAPPLMAYESIHEKTPVGEIRVLELPARTALEAKTPDNYFSKNNGLFRKLFGYISKHDLSMTTPVEADIEPGRMRFFVGAKDADKPIPNSDSVQVRKLEPMTVLAIGIRGGYSEENFQENKTALLNWLKVHPAYELAGSAYAVYWDGPFIPWFLKRSEIHLPIRPSEKQSSPNQTPK